MWTEDHERALVAVRKLEKENKLRALESGSFTGPKEEKEQLSADLQEFQRKREEADVEHAKKRRRIADITSKAEPLDFKNCTMLLAVDGPVQDLKSVARSSEATLVTNATDFPDYLVVNDLNKVLPIHMLGQALSGHCVCVPEFVMSRGLAGPCIAFKPCMRTPRKLWMSTEFSAEKPQWIDLVQRAMKLPGSKWQSCDELQYLTSLQSQKRRWDRVALVSTQEKQNNPIYKGQATALSPEDFFNLCSKLMLRALAEERVSAEPRASNSGLACPTICTCGLACPAAITVVYSVVGPGLSGCKWLCDLACPVARVSGFCPASGARGFRCNKGKVPNTLQFPKQKLLAAVLIGLHCYKPVLAKRVWKQKQVSLYFQSAAKADRTQ